MQARGTGSGSPDLQDRAGSSDDERKRASWNGYPHAEQQQQQHQHQVLLPRLLSTTYSERYDRQTGSSDEHEHATSYYPSNNTVNERLPSLSFHTTLSASAFGQERHPHSQPQQYSQQLHQHQHHQHQHQHRYYEHQQQSIQHQESSISNNQHAHQYQVETPRLARHITLEAEVVCTPPRVRKASLAFILDDQDHEDVEPEEKKQESKETEVALAHMDLNDSSPREDHDDGSSDDSIERYAHSGSEQATPPPAKASTSGRKVAVKKSRICKIDNCTRYVVNKGLCIGHGGGKRCAVATCTSSAKNMGVCWKHGGSTKCTIEGCDNRAKSRGVCWSHGGGRKCKEEKCIKTAVSNGLCWAHGGGKRCIFEGCKKPAYERNGNVCAVHKGSHAPSA